MPASEPSFDPYLEWLQVPANRRPPNHYDLLGLPDFESDVVRIRAAGLTRTGQVRRYQLGRHAEDALRLIGELSAAYDCLTTPERKLQYDEDLRAKLASQSISPQVPAAAPAIEIRTSAPAPARPSRGRPTRKVTFGLMAAGCVVVLLMLVFVGRDSASVTQSRPTSPQQKQPAKPRKDPSVNPTPAPRPRPPAAKSQDKWQVASARYGFGKRWADTTATVRQNIRNDRARFQVHNGTMRVDPAYGNIKLLQIELVRGAERRSVTFREGQWAVLNLAGADPTSP